jgi:hypothetical protein
MKEPFIGTSAYPNADDTLLKDAGIGWVRQGFSFPFADTIGGATTPAYQKAKSNAISWHSRGYRIMGVTPLYGIGLREPAANGRLEMVWHNHAPDYMGKPGTAEFLYKYQEVCRFLAQDLFGTVHMWQVANELNIPIFAGPLNPREASDLILSGARGLKMGDPGLIVGTNTACEEKAYFLYGRLHALGEGLLDYCGTDAYYATWEPGGPEVWEKRIAELYDLTGVKVLVNEWGYASLGGLLSAEDRLGEPYVCQHKKWYYAWGEGHTPAVQADFVRVAFDGFVANSDKLLGLFFYRWEDQEKCWQCGASDCPAETAWGLVTVDQKPKPAYYAFREGVARLNAATP